MKKVSFDLTLELFEKIRKSAYENNLKISEMLRKIIEEYYK